jgi:hypothetical protein
LISVIIFVLLFSFLLSALAVFHRVDRYQPELSRPFGGEISWRPPGAVEAGLNAIARDTRVRAVAGLTDRKGMLWWKHDACRRHDRCRLN